MKNILYQVSDDLAEKVNQENLPTVDLNIETPRLKGNGSLFSFLQIWIKNGLPMVFISSEMAFLQAYINSLALYFDQANSIQEINSTPDKPPLRGRRVRVIYMKKLMDLYISDTKLGEDFLHYLGNEVLFGKYIFVFNDFHELYDWRQETEKIVALKTRIMTITGRTSFYYIAPVTWDIFERDIISTSYIFWRHTMPVLFSPRPAQRSGYSISGIIKEDDYIFPGTNQLSE